MKDDAIYIDHILACIASVETYVEPGKEYFLSDERTYDAVLRKLQIMAESTQRLSEGLKRDIPEIDWEQIAGFRNILVHQYLGDLDNEILWRIINRRLGELRQALESYQEKKSP